MTIKLTKKKLIFFEQILEAIEERATACTDYIYRVKIPSVHHEHFDSMEVGTETFPGKTTVKKWLRGEYQYATFPTACLWDDEALAQYRLTKENEEHQRVLQSEEDQRHKELLTFKYLREKYEGSST